MTQKSQRFLMAVITGIRTVLRVSKRLEYKYRLLDPTNKFIQKYVPPPYRKNVRILKDILITGGVIYDPILEIYRAFQKKPRSGSVKQTRNYMEFPRSGRFSTSKRGFSSRSKVRRCRPRYRSWSRSHSSLYLPWVSFQSCTNWSCQDYPLASWGCHFWNVTRQSIQLLSKW